MTKRSTTTLARKLRERESVYVQSLRRDLPVQIRTVEAVVRRSPGSGVPTLLLEGLGDMLTRAFTQGAFLLLDFTEEVRIAADRDVTAVQASTGTDLTTVLAEWEPIGWQQGALVMWEEYVAGVGRRAGAEFQRQAQLSRVYDEDSESGLLARMFSFTALRRPGRRGVGILPSLISVLEGGIVTPAYGMVNAQRNALFREMADG